MVIGFVGEMCQVQYSSNITVCKGLEIELRRESPWLLFVIFWLFSGYFTCFYDEAFSDSSK